MYAKKLKHKYKASEASLNELIEAMPVATMEAEEDAKVEVREINPPIVNGINLREHPNKHQRGRFNAILDQGGIICGLFVDNNMVSFCPTLMNGTVGKKIEDFEQDRSTYVRNAVSRRIALDLNADFEDHGQGRLARTRRKKNMKPEDFWALFRDSAITVINNSLTPVIQDFVAEINGMNNVNIRTQKVRDGISILHVNNIINKRDYELLMET